MPEPIALPDIQAFQDVLDQLAEEVDGASFERLLELNEALADMAKRVRDVVSLLKTAQLNATKEPIRVGGKIWYSEPTGKWRPDHSIVEAKVVGQALNMNQDNWTPEEAVRYAVELMFDLYVSPSDVPKRAGLARINTTIKKVADYEITGHNLVSSDIKEVPE